MTRVGPRRGVAPAADADELIARYYARIFNLAFRTLGRREDAEDIAQQTFLRALPRLSDLRAHAAAGAWLCRIATNLCLDFLRSHQGEGISLDDDDLDSTPLPDPDRLATPAQAAELREERLAVWRATLALPSEQRMALALRELHAMSYAEIAESMGKSVGAVETLLFRARVGFRRAFEVAPLQTGGACKPILELLSSSIDGELDRREQARIDAHVPTCPTCQFAARELRATSRLYALIPVITPAAAKVTAASLLVGTVGGAAGGGVLVTTAGVAPTLLGGGAAATAAGGIWSSFGASAVGTTVAAVIAIATVSTSSTPAAAMTPPARVVQASLVAGRLPWQAESAESPPWASTPQPDGPQPPDRGRAEASNTARPTTATPTATPGALATPDLPSAVAPSTANFASVADQSAGTPTATPGAEARSLPPTAESRRSQTESGTPATRNAADTLARHNNVQSATDVQRRAGPPASVSADTEEPDEVLSAATSEGPVDVGRQAAAPEPERKPTPTLPDAPRHAVAGPPVDHSSRSKVRTQTEAVSERASGDDEQEVVANPTLISKGTGNSAAPGTAKASGAQDGPAPVDKAAAPSKVGASNGNGNGNGASGNGNGNAHAAKSDPKAIGAASPTPDSPNAKANGNGNGNGANGNGNGNAHAAPDPKTNVAASPTPDSSKGKGNNAHPAYDPKTNGAASPTSDSSNAKANANGNRNGNGNAVNGNDNRNAPAASDPKANGAASPASGASNGNGNGAGHAAAPTKSPA